MEELKRLKLFAGCSEEALKGLLEQPCRRQEYAAGRLMLRAGDPCRSLMILVKGQAEARMTGEGSVVKDGKGYRKWDPSRAQ